MEIWSWVASGQGLEGGCRTTVFSWKSRKTSVSIAGKRAEIRRGCLSNLRLLRHSYTKLLRHSYAKLLRHSYTKLLCHSYTKLLCHSYTKLLRHSYTKLLSSSRIFQRPGFYMFRSSIIFNVCAPFLFSLNLPATFYSPITELCLQTL
jgi:hypothetical protein